MKTNDILLACNVYSNYYYFLQVIKATERTVTVRRINSNKREGTPRPNDFLTEGGYYESPEQKRRIGNDGRIRLGDWTSAEAWDGQPLRNDHPMWGMNYNLY